MAHVVFCIAPDSVYVKHEFEQGHLRQGGVIPMDLHLPQDEWISRQRQRDERDGNRAYYIG